MNSARLLDVHFFDTSSATKQKRFACPDDTFRVLLSFLRQTLGIRSHWEGGCMLVGVVLDFFDLRDFHCEGLGWDVVCLTCAFAAVLLGAFGHRVETVAYSIHRLLFFHRPFFLCSHFLFLDQLCVALDALCFPFRLRWLHTRVMEWQFGGNTKRYWGGIHDGWKDGLAMDARFALRTDTAGFYVSTLRIQDPTIFSGLRCHFFL